MTPVTYYGAPAWLELRDLCKAILAGTWKAPPCRRCGHPGAEHVPAWPGDTKLRCPRPAG